MTALRPRIKDRIKDLSERRGVRLTTATGLVCCLGLVAFGTARIVPTDAVTRVDPLAARSELRQRTQADRVAPRSQNRASGAASVPAASTAAAPTDPDAPATERARPAEPAAPARVDPGPVAGLTAMQMDNAKAIVRTGRDMGMPRRALVIAVATAMQESNLYNLASGVLPESMDYPNQGVGWDHDSVGLFQQRSSTGWGPVGKLMDPAYATARFLEALMLVPGWDQLPLTLAAQAVQVSAFPWAYAPHEGRATVIADAILAGPK